jgi:hypothetical protein
VKSLENSVFQNFTTKGHGCAIHTSKLGNGNTFSFSQGQSKSKTLPNCMSFNYKITRTLSQNEILELKNIC